MGLRYRKSINIGPLRINASKTGLGYSVGTKGLRYTKCVNGRKRTTASIHGTGISYVTEHGNKKNDIMESKNTNTIWKVIKFFILLPLKMIHWTFLIFGLMFFGFIDLMNKTCK